ncbi:cytochrome P450 [Aspergillus ellipticus CBS 707.79]|uniref:Cytochrome P450 n=1 Tax=Aspergillus ellipticus CBS 707.79 TaxID=1448320 RepID=A0A319DNT8_9EURO|nr:cytochrome P450 [Aspergillus ellipticus CBS 707.79]
MLATAWLALTRAFYLFLCACLVRILLQLKKRPFPANAPKLIAGYPVVGALQLLFDQGRFCHGSKASSPTGSYSFYLGRHRVVGLAGPQGRKTFFEHRDLDLDQGTDIFIPVSNATEHTDDPSVETHGSHLRAAMRTALLRTDKLGFVPAAVRACTSATWDRIAASELIDPFQEMGQLYSQTSQAVLGIDEIARSPARAKTVRGIVTTLEGIFSPIDMVVPWLLNPMHIPAVVAVGRLYALIWQVVRNRKQQQGRRDVKSEGMLQDLLDRNTGMRGIMKATSPSITSWLLIGLAANADWMARVRQEVEQAVRRHGKEDQSTEHVLDHLDVHACEHEFPLLEACLLESIRIAGPPLLFRKNIGPADIPIGDTGEVVPKGAYAMHYVEDAHQDPDIYPDPRRWDPARFLADRAEHRKAPMGYIGFGLGRRTCRKLGPCLRGTFELF